MANKGRTQIEKIARWKVLESRLGERLAEIPSLTESLAELRGLITEAEALEAEVELHRAAAQVATVKRTAIASAGEILRSHMVLALQFRFGATDKQLLEFGIRPRAGGKKKAAAPKAPGSGSKGPQPQADALTAEPTPPTTPEPA
jgi:hypothetical protein